MTEQDFSIFELGDFSLVSGEFLPSAFLAYKTFGDPKNPVLIYPTWYGGSKISFFLSFPETESPRDLFQTRFQQSNRRESIVIQKSPTVPG